MTGMWYATIRHPTPYIKFGILISNNIGDMLQTKFFQKLAAARDFQQCGMCDQQSLGSACPYVHSDQSLCLSLEYSMSVKLLTEHHLEFLSLKGGCTGSSKSTLVKMPHLSWKSNVTTQMRSEVKVMVTVTPIWYATLHHPKMHLGFLPQIM